MKIMSISLSEDLYEKLRYMVPANKISKFINELLTRELTAKENELIQAYQAAEIDKERQHLLKEWDAIDDFS